MNNVTTAIAALWAKIKPAEATAVKPRSRPPQTRRKTAGKSTRRATTMKPTAPAIRLPRQYTERELGEKISAAASRLEMLLGQHPYGLEFRLIVERIRLLLERFSDPTNCNK